MAEKRSGSKQLSPLMVYGLICLGVVLVVLTLNGLEMFDHAENSTYDLRFRIRGVETHNDDIVIVAIDPQTLDMLGLIGMPPRDYHVKLMENLARLCGATITEPIREGLAKLDPEEKGAVGRFGIEFATEQCRGLLKHGVPGLHFYTMNRGKGVSTIVQNLRDEGLL